MIIVSSNDKSFTMQTFQFSLTFLKDNDREMEPHKLSVTKSECRARPKMYIYNLKMFKGTDRT